MEKTNYILSLSIYTGSSVNSWAMLIPESSIDKQIKIINTSVLDSLANANEFMKLLNKQVNNNLKEIFKEKILYSMDGSWNSYISDSRLMWLKTLGLIAPDSKEDIMSLFNKSGNQNDNIEQIFLSGSYIQIPNGKLKIDGFSQLISDLDQSMCNLAIKLQAKFLWQNQGSNEIPIKAQITEVLDKKTALTLVSKSLLSLVEKNQLTELIDSNCDKTIKKNIVKKKL